jgi:hypothetical protein
MVQQLLGPIRIRPRSVPREINHGPPKISNELASHIIPRFTAPVEAMKMATRGRRRLPSSFKRSCQLLQFTHLLVHSFVNGVNASSIVHGSSLRRDC